MGRNGVKSVTASRTPLPTRVRILQHGLNLVRKRMSVFPGDNRIHLSSYNLECFLGEGKTFQRRASFRAPSRFLQNSLPTKNNLYWRGVTTVPRCPRCGTEDETEAHVIRDCNFTMRFWFASPLSLRTKEDRETGVNEWVMNLMKKLDRKEVRRSAPWLANCGGLGIS
ncbi:hypothetical protein PIB30_064329 [Stylosanthes scabra]|uniref:Reverse transcriptase zinc-binding domain-containing protein n=1 Tax=Stylosanthes scabra TaxID=79078 RepID=A0ABU6WPI2_9FABA|nr:hypothetical protein [Stylosanthes scabra]